MTETPGKSTWTPTKSTVGGDGVLITVSNAPRLANHWWVACHVSSGFTGLQTAAVPDEPTTTPVDRMKDRIADVLDSHRIQDLVATYLDPDPRSPFAGTSFDSLGGNPPNAFTVDDLLAVTMLDVRVRPPAVRALLTTHGDEFGGLLAAIGPDVDMWLADDATLAAAEKLGDRLDELPGIGPAIASKMLARKRPRLVPIADSVVRRALHPPDGGFWITLRGCLESDDLRDRIERLRPPFATGVSLLRLLDAAIWMRGSGAMYAKAARRLVGKP